MFRKLDDEARRNGDARPRDLEHGLKFLRNVWKPHLLVDKFWSLANRSCVNEMPVRPSPRRRKS